MFKRGVDWTEASGIFSLSRSRASLAVANGCMWLLGGASIPGGYCIRSSNGVDWETAAPDWPFAPRWDCGLAILGDKFYLTGGGDSQSVYNHVWAVPIAVNLGARVDQTTWGLYK